jgi:hypothetical protein
MWILEWLPDFVFHLIVIAGVLGILAAQFFTFLPFVSQYTTPIRIVSIILLVVGIWFEGGISNEAKWQARVTELQLKVAEAEKQSAKQNTIIVEKIVTKTQLIKEKGDNVIKYIDRELVKYDNQCVIPDEFVKAHNDAAGSVK